VLSAEVVAGGVLDAPVVLWFDLHLDPSTSLTSGGWRLWRSLYLQQATHPLSVQLPSSCNTSLKANTS